VSQRLNGIMLPVVLICMMLIINNKEIMGEYTNKKVMNVVGWATIGILVALSVMMVVTSIF
jgi:Mn2+/Fe2+ NRAMP family transporter